SILLGGKKRSASPEEPTPRVGVMQGWFSKFRSLVRRVLARLGGRAGRIGFWQLAVLFHLLRMRPAVVHAHDSNTLAACWLASRLTRAKLVYDAHEISTSREGYSASLRKTVAWLESRVMP